MKALSSFLMVLTTKTDDLESNNVCKLHWPRMLHGLLADSVDTTSASLLCSWVDSL